MSSSKTVSGITVYLVLAAALVACLSGCAQFVPANAVLWQGDLRMGIPAMEGEDWVMRGNCVSQGSVNGSIITVDCSVALSNGVTDLLNDIHTATQIANALSGFRTEEILKSRVTDACINGLFVGYINAIQQIPEGPYRDAAVNYVVQHVSPRAGGYCSTAVDMMWNETNNDVHSGGTTCAVGKARISLVSVNLPPVVEFSTGAIPDVICPRSRVVLTTPGPDFLPDLYWGND
jgi:hypothetical protein